jgi:hypothetical protein
MASLFELFLTSDCKKSNSDEIDTAAPIIRVPVIKF